MTQQMEHLLIISIGPVQDFIAAARKCQDLWFGSFLLSELARKLAQGLLDQNAKLIFPGSKLDSDSLSVANKVVATLPPQLTPEAAVDQAQRRMKCWLDTFAKAAFDKCEAALKVIPDGGNPLFLRKVAQQQIDDLIELQWVAVPISDYAVAHADAERLLSWRKNTRDFQCVPWESGNVPKSSIDGQRESVIRDEFFDRTKNKDHLGAKYRLGVNERLCGVGILKRYGEVVLEEDEREQHTQKERRPVFHSNSHVAAGPLFQRMKVQGEPAQKELKDYIAALRNLGVLIDQFKVRPKHHNSHPYDGYLLYPDRLPEVFAEASTVPLDRASQQEATRRAQSAHKALLDALDCPQSEAYYVMLAADGDRMGVAIRELADRPGGIAKHQVLSDRLAEFAQQARTIIDDEHAGSLIYSGGDDVLALLPLHTALECARKLSEQFIQIVHPACLDLKEKPTLSVGLAVVHHLEHMGRARKLAHDAEKLAKQTRNSLAIIVDKRSGGTIQVSGQWDETPTSMDGRIKEWVELLMNESLPDGVAFELLEVLAPFEVPSPTQEAPPDETPPQPPAKELESLVRRVFARKRSAGGQAELPDDLVKKLEARIQTDSDPIAAVRALSYELQIAREFARATKLAEGK